MGRLANIRANSTAGQLFEGQLQHFGLAVLLTAGAVALLYAPPDEAGFLGLTSSSWAKVSISFALLHQILVAYVFRMQLHRNMMTRAFGKRDMHIWRTLFMPLLVIRPVTVLAVALADTTQITGYRLPEALIGVALLIASGWALHSTFVYFTLPRALGGDHFRDEYVQMPLERRGAFAVTPNAMYAIAFLGLWGIALTLGSWNALIVAFFQHVYIWVHMYCTEGPDMRLIYSDDLPEWPPANVSGKDDADGNGKAAKKRRFGRKRLSDRDILAAAAAAAEDADKED